MTEHDRVHGWVNESDSTEDILRSLTSWATSVKVTSAMYADRIGTWGLETRQADPVWLKGVGDRIDHAVDVLRKKMEPIRGNRRIGSVDRRLKT